LPSFQAIKKWAARFDLGLSPSVPVVEFKPKNITLIDDDCELCPTLVDLTPSDNVGQMHPAMTPGTAK
jgi:hypothetical protein